jgi:hypothetical protein
MKQQNGSLKFRFLVFVIAVVCMAAGCKPVAVLEPPEEDEPLVPVSPGIIPQIVMPPSFYLSNDYKPAEADAGKTAFAAIFNGPEDSVCNFAGIAEELGSGAVAVRFLDGKNNMAVSLYFSANSEIPEYFILNHGEESGLIGIFSDYNKSQKTFSLFLQYGDGPVESYVFPNIALNAIVYLMDNPTVRERKYSAAANVWAALMRQLAGQENIASAIADIRLVGGMVKSFGFNSFAEDATVAPGTLIAVTGRQPVIVASSIIEPITATGNGVNEPCFKLYYKDESEVEHPVPVTREGIAPDITQQFYIRPQVQPEYASKVKLYFKVSGATGQLMLRPTLSRPGGLPYAPVNVRAGDGGVHYIEVNKHNGYLKSDQTRLVVKVVNGTVSLEKNPAYFSSYKVNGTEFHESEGFVINFLDYATPAQQAQLLVPQSTAILIPPVYDFSMPDVVFPGNDELLAMAAALAAAAQ